MIDPTLTLPNLTPLLEKMNWDDVSSEMDIPKATVDMIRSSGGTNSQRRQRCCEVYLKENPAASWKDVADILYDQTFAGMCIEELEVVQKKYLRGESHW